jgi:Uma2 family endonuclease
MREDSETALEYACGEVVPKPEADQHHAAAQVHLMVALFQFAEPTKSGHVLPELRCIFGSLGRERAVVPDIIYVAEGRLGRERYLQAAPDLAIEIFCHGEDMARFIDKVQFYLINGVRSVWVLDPYTRSVAVLVLGEEARVFTPGDTLDGGDVLPGFSVPVDDIFARLQ